MSTSRSADRPLRVDPVRLAALEAVALATWAPGDIARMGILDLCADLRALRGLPQRVDPADAPLTHRPLVAAYANAMEKAMRANDDKGPDGGWRNDPIKGLLNHLQEEVNELRDTCLSPYRIPARLRAEAADVGAMAAMCADAMGVLSLEK